MTFETRTLDTFAAALPRPIAKLYFEEIDEHGSSIRQIAVMPRTMPANHYVGRTPYECSPKGEAEKRGA